MLFQKHNLRCPSPSQVCCHFSGFLLSYLCNSLLAFLGASFLRKPTRTFSASDDLTKPLAPSFVEPILPESLHLPGPVGGTGNKTELQKQLLFLFSLHFSMSLKPSSETKQTEPAKTTVSKRAFQDQACC